jgi:hypothetical protein
MEEVQQLKRAAENAIDDLETFITSGDVRKDIAWIDHQYVFSLGGLQSPVRAWRGICDGFRYHIGEHYLRCTLHGGRPFDTGSCGEDCSYEHYQILPEDLLKSGGDLLRADIRLVGKIVRLDIIAVLKSIQE